MCCFSRPVRHVSATHIFARHLNVDSTRQQALVYSMNVEIDDALAMVLPLPVPAGCADDAVRFVDLSGYPKFFDDLQRAFPAVLEPPKRGGLMAAQARLRPKLEVHEVGAFVASFVPSPRDFDRLDERFRLSPAVFEAKREYADWGFAVFQLAPRRGWFQRSRRQTIHPMALTFPSRRPLALFFPTLHVHDGSVPDRASFDHSLYCQTDDVVLRETVGFERSDEPLGAWMDGGRACNLVDPEAIALRTVVRFEQPNVDHWYEAPRCAGPHVLRGAGELFSFRLSALAAYYTSFDHPPARRWHDAARTKLDALHAGLVAGLKQLTSDRRDAWGLIPLDGMIEQAWLSNDEPHGSGSIGPTKLEPGAKRSVRIAVTTGPMQEVEPQGVDLAFARVPSREAIAEIRSALRQIVARAVA